MILDLHRPVRSSRFFLNQARQQRVITRHLRKPENGRLQTPMKRKISTLYISTSSHPDEIDPSITITMSDETNIFLKVRIPPIRSVNLVYKGDGNLLSLRYLRPE